MEHEKIHTLLTRGVETVVERSHLEDALRSGRKLCVKLGIDPTSPDLHLGHAVVLRKLREFQDLGHKAVLIIGDFTAQIGDPSGRSEARKPLADAEIKRNMKTYLAQAGKVIDVKRAEVRKNSEWYKKGGPATLLELARAATFQQALKREDFKKRIAEGGDVSLLETLYPLLQGYDSVAVRADVELGGEDQLLNLLMGRRVQRHFHMKEQDVMTTPLLEGIDGVRKMSKSFGNYVAIQDPPDEMFGKIMRIPDAIVEKYFVVCTDLDHRKVASLKKSLKPRDLKVRLALEITKRYHSAAVAESAVKRFNLLFSKKDLSGALPELKLPRGPIAAVDVAIRSGVVKSRSEAWRRGLSVDGRRIDKPGEKLSFRGGEIIKIGKRHFFRVRI